MKYLKKYEKVKRDFKKFLIINNEGHYYEENFEWYEYYIVRYLGYLDADERFLETKFVFGYSDSNNFTSGINLPYTLNKSKIEILYQSDKLYDCKEQLKIIEDSNKYNL